MSPMRDRDQGFGPLQKALAQASKKHCTHVMILGAFNHLYEPLSTHFQGISKLVHLHLNEHFARRSERVSQTEVMTTWS